jgi:hypothetical protein
MANARRGQSTEQVQTQDQQVIIITHSNFRRHFAHACDFHLFLNSAMHQNKQAFVLELMFFFNIILQHPIALCIVTFCVPIPCRLCAI